MDAPGMGSLVLHGSLCALLGNMKAVWMCLPIPILVAASTVPGPVEPAGEADSGSGVKESFGVSVRQTKLPDGFPTCCIITGPNPITTFWNNRSHQSCFATNASKSACARTMQ